MAKIKAMRNLILISFVGLSATLGSPFRNVDYSHQPPIWRTPLGLPGDWHKSLLDQDGAWAGDFGPGPYAQPLTRIFFTGEGDSFETVDQSIPDPRVPIVLTTKASGEALIEERAFSRLPEELFVEPETGREAPVLRRQGLNRAPDYASPPGADPAFRTAAYGTNRPVEYFLRPSEKGPWQVFLGFADPYRSPASKVKRLMTLEVEGAEAQTVSVVHDGGQNGAQVYRFLGRDIDQDGRLHIEVGAALETSDPNVFISAIWVFHQETGIDIPALIRGDLNDRALLHVDCGHEPQWQLRDQREDLIEARFTNLSSAPVLRVETRRSLEFDASKSALTWRGQPFVIVQPKPEYAEQVGDGWLLHFPLGTTRALVRVFDGGRIAPEKEIADIEGEIERLHTYWHSSGGLPWDRIGVSDPSLQALIEGSIRVIYQLLERVDGKLQSQPGPSVYRGLWVSNQPRVGRALTHLGDLATARSSFERTWEFQVPDGRVIVLTPPSLLKETGTAAEAVYRHARLTNDTAYLESYWPRFKKAAAWVMAARQSITDPDALNYGLMPSGLSDGGVGGVVPEYTSVYWGLYLLKLMREAASWLGHYEEALQYGAAYADFEAAFRRAALRDHRIDAAGNRFLPMKMEFDPLHDAPPAAQTVFSYLYYPARLFDKRDPLAEGNFAMLLDAPKAEGLILSTGWLEGGLQPFIENTRASARLYRGEVAVANEVLYAIANHASPTHVWVEEQLPGQGPRKTTGDVPHSSASAEFLNLIRYMLALEEGEHLHLIKGVTKDWIRPGETLFTDGLPTEFGPLSLRLTIGAAGDTATLDLAPVEGAGLADGGVLLHLTALREAGFSLAEGIPLPDTVGVTWGKGLHWTLHREGVRPN